MKYDVFVIDPPWPKQKGGRRKVRPKQGRALSYTTMSVAGIFTLLDHDIFTQAAPNKTVFLWTVDQFLSVADAAMSERGYRRHARIVWNKTNGVAPAFSVRFTHEYLLWYYAGAFQPIAENMRGKLTTVWTEQAREHSRKPDIAYSNIEKLYPGASRLDVFSREERAGWSTYGNEKGFFSREGESKT